MIRKQKWIWLVPAIAIIVLLWQAARAESPSVSHPAQQQILAILPTLRDSEAEAISGAYYPGVGAFLAIDLLRGPNSVPNRPAYESTRDWAIYLMQTFGPTLNAVPANETIGMSINYYDYAATVYHQLVITARANDIADPNKYAVYLDGKPYDEATAQLPPPPTPSYTAPTALPPTALPIRTATSLPGITAAPTPVPPKTPGITAGNFSTNVDFTKAGTNTADWNPVNGQWAFVPEGYRQNELGKFDLISYYLKPVNGDYRLTVTMRYLGGDMGGGVIFNAPSNSSKNNAQMVSYTGKGTYLQWGPFDNAGVHQFKGGAVVPNGSDGQPHTLVVVMQNKKARISLDGKVVGDQIALSGTEPGYVGLLASTSQVLFERFQLEPLNP